jgi:hypothetical protein
MQVTIGGYELITLISQTQVTSMGSLGEGHPH